MGILFLLYVVVPIITLIALIWACRKIFSTDGNNTVLLRKLNQIMATQAELTAQINTLTANVNKIGTETRTLLTKIDELTEVINNQGEVSTELQTAVDNLQEQVNVVDSLVPDAPTEPTEPEA